MTDDQMALCPRMAGSFFGLLLLTLPISSCTIEKVTPTGTASVALSELVLSATTVASGSTLSVAVATRDESGNPVVSDGLLVIFTAEGTGAGTFSTTTQDDEGTYRGSFTATTAGETVITAYVDGVALETTATITIVPGPASVSTSQITLSAPSVVSAESITVTLTARDAANNALTQGGLTVAFSLSGSPVNGTFASVTDNNNGTYSATFTGTTIGQNGIISATIGGVAVTHTATVRVTVGPASPSQSLITLSAGTVPSGSAITVTLATRDANGNLLGGGGKTVVFSLSGGTSTGTFSSVTDPDDGTYTATFTGVNAGTATSIAATIDGEAVISALPTVTVNPGTLNLAQTTVSVSSATVASASGATVTLTKKDAAGNNITSGGDTVAFGRSGGTSTGTFGSVTDVGNGTYTATFTGVVSGTATTITATVNSSSVTSSLPTVTVTPGPLSLAQTTVTRSAATVASGAGVTVTLTKKDAAGNNITSGGDTVAFSFSGGTSTVTFGTVNDAGNGTYNATLTGVVSGTASTLGATINAQAVTSSMPTVTVTPGTISAATSTLSVSDATPDLGDQMTVTLTGKDAAGNNVTSGGATVAFSISGGTSSGTFGSTNDVGNGTYTSTFTATAAGTTSTIGATVNAVSVSTSLPSVTVSEPVRNLVTPIEILQIPVESSTGDITWNLSSTGLDTADYTGTVTYFFEIIASNSDGAGRNVELVNGSSTNFATVNVPSGVGLTRIRSAGFSPTVGSDTYRIKTPATTSSGDLKVVAARIIIHQVNATQTRLHFPLLTANYQTFRSSDDTSAAFALHGSGTGQDNGSAFPKYYASFTKTASSYTSPKSGTPWRLEVVGSATTGTGASYALYNAGTGQAITETSGTHGTSIALTSHDFSDSATHFSDSAIFELRHGKSGGGQHYLYRATLSVLLYPLKKGEVCYRIGQQTDSSGAIEVLSSRHLIDLSGYSSPTVVFQAEMKTDGGSGGSVEMRSCGTGDSGACGTTVGSSTIDSAFSTTAFSLQRTGTLSLTDDNRYVAAADAPTSAVHRLSCLIVQFQ